MYAKIVPIKVVSKFEFCVVYFKKYFVFFQFCANMTEPSPINEVSRQLTTDALNVRKVLLFQMDEIDSLKRTFFVARENLEVEYVLEGTSNA